jgi:chromosome segregation ATPase
VAPERKRSARDYEQALRRQELAAGRALVQALAAEGSPGPRELAAARRVLTQSLFELRRLGRDLDQEIEGLRARSKGAGTARPAAQRSNPGELERLEAVRNAVEEVAERWEGRRDQLSAELDRRQPRQARQPRRTNEVRNRGAAAPARPGRPQSPRSRRSRG